MLHETSVDTMKAENDFCSICLRTKAEVKLDLIATKMYQMFFIELAKCVESKNANRTICVWCRRRVVNALKLVETAQTTDRILTNITQMDNSHCQLFKQTVWGQIQANRRTYGLKPRTSRVIACGLPLDTKTSLSVKLEHDGDISGEERNISINSAINENLKHKIQSSKETSVLTSKTSQVVSCNLLSDTRIDSLVKLERDDEISIEGGNVCLNGVTNEDELDHKDMMALERQNFLASPQRSIVDNELTSQLNIEEKTPCPNEVRNWNSLKTYTRKKMKEMELRESPHTEVLKLKPVDADGNRTSVSKVVNVKNFSKLTERVSNNALRGVGIQVGIKDSDTNSQTTFCSADMHTHIRLLQLTEAQRLRELEERRQEMQYRKAAFKCEPCVLGFAFRGTYDAHMQRHLENYGSHKCSVCNIYFKDKKSYQYHCKIHYERYACTVCGLNFLSRQGALDHFVSQHTNERFKCQHCVSEFGNASRLKVHMRSVHNAKRPHCPHCSTKSSCKTHKAQNNSSEKGDSLCSLCCEVCSRIFSSGYHLRRHRETHSTKKTLLCQRCGKKFKSWRSLYDHRRRKHPVVHFECDYCQKTFGFKGDLRKHITWMHLGHGFKCQFCSKMVRFKFLLERHIKQEHETVCEVCGEEFSNFKLLDIHRGMHSPVRPYRCTVCPTGYRHHFWLKRHMQLVHKIDD